MLKILNLLRQHVLPAIVFGAVLGGCIYTGNWVPFFVLCVACFLVAVVAVVVMNLSSKKDINIYIVGNDDTKYVSDELFEEEIADNETVH